IKLVNFMVKLSKDIKYYISSRGRYNESEINSVSSDNIQEAIIMYLKKRYKGFNEGSKPITLDKSMEWEFKCEGVFIYKIDGDQISLSNLTLEYILKSNNIPYRFENIDSDIKYFSEIKYTMIKKIYNELLPYDINVHNKVDVVYINGTANT